MVENIPKPIKILVDREKLMELSAKRCPACGGTFEMGEVAVLACGAWEGGPRFVHEKDAVYDPETKSYVEKKCYSAKAGVNK